MGPNKMHGFTLDNMVELLKAIAESTRLRILLMLEKSDLTVTDLTQILGQSQPRVSRHLRLLNEAGLVGRYQEGAWAYFHLMRDRKARHILQAIEDYIDFNDALLDHDLARLEQIKQARRVHADNYFSANASSWDKLRLLHVPDQAVEQALLDDLGGQTFQHMLDMGTGTATLLQLFAPYYVRAMGVDLNRDMLAIARVNLEKAGIENAHVRQADVTALPFERDSFDLITLHQVLHFLDTPQLAINEAARTMRPNGILAIVDFAPHGMEELRNEFAHLRLGFSTEQITNWLEDAGLELEKQREFKLEDNQEGLTVKLWLARDPRQLLAAQSDVGSVA